MRIGISTVGSRGDVQPVAALTHEFSARGHHVRVATHERYRTFIEDAGGEFVSTGHGFASEDVWSGDEGRRLFATTDPVAYAMRFARRVRPHVTQHMREVRDAFRDVDVVAGLQTVEMVSRSVASALQKPYVALHVNAPDPRFFYDPIRAVVVPRLADWAARLSGQRAAFRQAQLEALGSAALPPPPREMQLLGLSTYALATPADWGDDVLRTGFWFYDENVSLDLATERFLGDGPAPIGVGFGSMPAIDAAECSAAIVDAASRTGHRILFIAGASSLGLPNSAVAHTVASAPHHRLLPRLAAFAHHGGAGTTAAAMRAGIPQIVVPHFGDQFFWARRVVELGVGATLARDRVTTEKDIERAFHEGLACSAAALPLARAVAAEAGAADAVKEIQRWTGADVKSIADS